MGLSGAKALRNTENERTELLIREKKVENALKTYPFLEISSDLFVRINPRAKRMALRVNPKKRRVTLVVPKNGGMRDAYKFALEHKYWIRQKIEELPEPIHFVHGAVISLLGEKVKIIVSYNETLKKTDIKLKNNKLFVSTNKTEPSKRIKRWIIEHAKENLTALAHKKAASIGKKIKQIDVKDTTSRWGSCSHDRKLSFSWRLIFAPPHAFDYVVGHEVAHMRVMDHSPEFWHECEALCENYSKGKSWMRRNSGQLIRYS